ncbi:hypothetical protein ABKN59_003616 [Abortiporus biennis]
MQHSTVSSAYFTSFGPLRNKGDRRIPTLGSVSEKDNGASSPTSTDRDGSKDPGNPLGMPSQTRYLPSREHEIWSISNLRLGIEST